MQSWSIVRFVMTIPSLFSFIPTISSRSLEQSHPAAFFNYTLRHLAPTVLWPLVGRRTTRQYPRGSLVKPVRCSTSILLPGDLHHLAACPSVESIHLQLPSYHDLTRAHSTYHSRADLILACVESIVTFKLAYRACVVLGTVLLQTSPPRGQSGGRMEAFLRAMKEVRPTFFHLTFFAALRLF
jgi:hypothetical protein